MLKRKLDNNIVLLDNTCTKLFTIDNHIYFNFIIDSNSLHLLRLKINDITNNYIFTENDHYIYIHINSCGGFIKDILSNLDLFDNSIKLISIIENNISDCAILLSGLCYSRICKMHAKINMRVVLQNYWYLLKQCDINEIQEFNNNLEHLFIKISNNKLSPERVQNIIKYGGRWTSKKVKRFGFVDEII